MMKLLTITESAKLLRVHPNTIRNLIVAGKLPAYRIGRVIRIEEADLIDLAKKEQVQA